MGDRGLKYAIVTSNGTLLVTFLFMTVMWVVTATESIGEVAVWGGYLATVVVGYFLLELNNRNALLRVRSRMVSSVFLVIAGVMPAMQHFNQGFIPAACLLISLYIIFFSYQDRRAQGYAFYCFLFLGIAAVVYPRMLWTVPLFLIYMSVQLRSLTAKSFFAAALGLGLPLLVTWTYLTATGAAFSIPTFTAAVISVPVPDYRILSEHQVINAGFLLLLTFIAAIHFWRTKFNDKIRTRMLLYIFMISAGTSAVMLVAIPSDFNVLFRLFIVVSCPLIAHHLSFARGHISDAYFGVVVVCFAFLTFYNYTGYEFGIWRP